MFHRFFGFLVFLFFCFNLQSQTPELVIPAGHTRDVLEAIYSPDGKKIITSSWDGTVKFWDARTGFLLKDIRAHNNMIMDLCLSPNGRFLATASVDKTVRVWNLLNGELAVNYTEHNKPVSSVRFSPAGDYMASLSYEQLSIWKSQP